MIARKFNSLKRPAPKVIALDCDQTLWGGVCGEMGGWNHVGRGEKRVAGFYARATGRRTIALFVQQKQSRRCASGVRATSGNALKLEHFAARKSTGCPNRRTSKRWRGI